MARAIWTGSIAFGLVSIPVGLYTATDDHTIHFHQFQRGTSDRVRNKRVNERTGREIEFDDIVKGADVGDGEHVIVEPDELDAIAPGRSRSLEISEFVDLDEIDPIYFQRTYWLAPTSDEYAKPYALLRQAMNATNRAGIGTFVMRGKEYLAAVRADRDVLAMHTLYFADEVRDPGELEHVPGRRAKRGTDKELDMATGLIESMSTPWRPEQHRDSYEDRVRKLIEDKHRGREVVTESEPPEPTEMSDLLDALQRSVEAARKSGSTKRTSGTAKSKSAKSSATKPADLGSASKQQLLRLARELNVPGRSSMTRDQLATAVRRAS
ncbi:MAG TPA: Ku protein [Pseudonocardia sp.]|jgi:DNA end-binding protein Ku|nr:Ku protein [Pseudonocardia sp.]